MAAFFILFAPTLQIFITVMVEGNYLRLSASDLLLPVSLLCSFVLWWSGGRPMPSPPLRHFAVWLGGLAAWLGVSVVIGYVRIGYLEPWGLINKFVGFFWLIAYAAAGYALVRFAGRREIDLFLRGLLLSAWAIALYSVISCIEFTLGLPGPFPPMWRAIGLSENPNAYGCLLAVILVIETAFCARGMLFSRRWHLFGMVVLILALLMTGSRSAWFGLAGGLALLLWLRHLDVRHLALVAVLTALCLSPLYLQLPIPLSASTPGAVPHTIYLQEKQVIQQNMSVSHRVVLTRQALELWASAPVTGAGLGAFLAQQKEARIEEPATIHTTALWLLAETGLIGLGLFLGFFVYGTRMLWRARGHADPHQSVFVTATLAMLAVAAIASVGTELLYQRHLWFLLGMAWVSVRSYDPAASRVNSDS